MEKSYYVDKTRKYFIALNIYINYSRNKER